MNLSSVPKKTTKPNAASSALALIDRKLRQNKTVGHIRLQINKFHAIRWSFGRVLEGVQTRFKIVRRINVRRPLIAAGIKVTGRFVAQ
jgi:hypothetical protein